MCPPRLDLLLLGLTVFPSSTSPSLSQLWLSGCLCSITFFHESPGLTTVALCSQLRNLLFLPLIAPRIAFRIVQSTRDSSLNSNRPERKQNRGRIHSGLAEGEGRTTEDRQVLAVNRLQTGHEDSTQCDRQCAPVPGLDRLRKAQSSTLRHGGKAASASQKRGTYIARRGWKCHSAGSQRVAAGKERRTMPVPVRRRLGRRYSRPAKCGMGDES